MSSSGNSKSDLEDWNKKFTEVLCRQFYFLGASILHWTSRICIDRKCWCPMRQSLHYGMKHFGRSWSERLQKSPWVKCALVFCLRSHSNHILVPLGSAITGIILTLGITSFVRNQKHKSQYYMRARVAAQGFTVLALCFGVAGNSILKSFGKKESE